MSLKKAIVTTLRDADATLASFIQYHLQIGFDHLFLFFDDPDAVVPDYVTENPKISAFPRNDALEAAWETTSVFLSPQIARSINSEVMSRQGLNAELALRKAFLMDIKWLLHIDVDELFYSKNTSVQNHFNMLESNGIHAISYPNMEGVSEKKVVNDFFKEVTLFKINPELKPNWGRIKKNRELIKKIPQIPHKFFHYYSSHKSAIRVYESTIPRGVHNFSLPPNGVRRKFSNGPMILHYPCCGIDHFKQKYKTLGSFGDQWFGNGSRFFINLDAHLNGRDIVSTNDESRIASYYISNFVLSSQQDINALLNAGLCERIIMPSSMLKSLQKSPKAPKPTNG